MASPQDPDYTGQVLNDVRKQIAVDDDVLAETKDRRDLVKRIARKFDGHLTTECVVVGGLEVLAQAFERIDETRVVRDEF